MRISCLILLLVLPAAAQKPPRPRLLNKTNPEYTPEAKAAQIQGRVILRVVVNGQGVADPIEVISPLGFGLDQAAVQAVSQWRFAPAMADGKPVDVPATIEVNFRLVGRAFDSKAEERRGAFNKALATLQKNSSDEGGLRQMERLASEKYPPAMHYYGILLREGKAVPADAARSSELIEAAAAKDFGPALYEVAKRRLHPDATPSETADGLRQMAQAAHLGSTGSGHAP